MSEETKTPEAVEEQKAEETQAEAPAEETKEEAAAEAPAEDTSSDEASDDSSADEDEVEVPEEFKALIEQVENMSVLELNSLVKVLEKKFGVSAAAVAVAGPGAGAAAEEKTEFDVVLKSFGDSKIPVMKAVKEILGLGLKEAKEMVEGAPATIKEAIKKEEAEEIAQKINDAGGEAELK